MEIRVHLLVPRALVPQCHLPVAGPLQGIPGNETDLRLEYIEKLLTTFFHYQNPSP